MKLDDGQIVLEITGCRSPHGERGLKLCLSRLPKNWTMSLPPRGAWIEIGLVCVTKRDIQVAPPTGSVD